MLAVARFVGESCDRPPQTKVKMNEAPGSPGQPSSPGASRGKMKSWRGYGHTIPTTKLHLPNGGEKSNQNQPALRRKIRSVASGGQRNRSGSLLPKPRETCTTVGPSWKTPQS